MKKIILLSLFALTYIVGYSQNAVTQMKSDIGNTSDTITNTGSTYVQINAIAVYEQVSIEAVVTKISGTVAGTVLLSGSNDAVNYINLNTDTLSNTDVTTNKKMWVITGNKYLYYRLTGLGSGTMAASLKGYFYGSGQGGTKRASNFMSSVRGFASDTVTNSATKTLSLQVRNFYKTVTIQVVATKISGTAGGTVTLQGSNDGTNYVTVSTDYSDAQTMTVLNQTTTTKFLIVTGSPYAYYRLSYTGTGTMAVRLRGYLVPN